MPEHRVAKAVGLLLLTAAAPAGAFEVQFSAFSDLNVGLVSDRPVDPASFDNFTAFGRDPVPTNVHKGFGISGVDFVVAVEMTDRFNFLAELNVQLNRGRSSDIELDPERIMLDYRINNLINLRGGIFFTPIGYHNRTLYSRALLMRSATVPDLFEEEVGLVATHTIGVQAYGTINTFSDNWINWAVSVGNGRGRTPQDAVLARDFSGFKEITALVEWNFPWFRDFRIGLSGYFDQLDTFRVAQLGQSVDITDPSAERILLNEIAFNPFVNLETKYVNARVEYVMVTHIDVLGNIGSNTVLHGLLAEVSLNLLEEGQLHPYVRFDLARPDPNDAYYGLTAVDDRTLTRAYIPPVSALMVGVAYDISTVSRLKLEYIRNFAGARQENMFLIQSAWGF